LRRGHTREAAMAASAKSWRRSLGNADPKRRLYGIGPTGIFFARYGTAPGATYCFYVELLPLPSP